ncbi:MAG: GNAT family N-acetyltransferase [Planctomycetota bacterium]
MGPRAGEAAITPDCAEACARFGLFPAPTSGPAQAASPRWDDAATALAERDPRISLLSGDSGSGKSRFLGAFVRQRLAAGERVIVADPAPLAAERTRPVIECVGQGSVDERLGRLARAGLSEAALLARTPAELSEGERHRLALARAMACAAQPAGTRRAWLVIDECCSVLDRATAQGVAHTLARWVRSDAGEIRLLAAGAHEDLPRLLGPDCVVQMPTCVIRNGKPARPPRVRIEDGTWDDYASLAHHHYRAGRPATRERVLCAHRRLPNGSTRIAGALVVSRPTLNGAHRQLAWPGRYHGAAARDEQRAQAARINRELRCISRVVVEPASRGLGIAKRLVEAYLNDPAAPAAESIASMGAACPFFERAGMTAYPLLPTPAALRFGDALAHAGIEPRCACAPAAASALAADPLIASEAHRWRTSRGRGRPACTDDAHAIRLASAALIAPGVAFAWSAP